MKQDNSEQSQAGAVSVLIQIHPFRHGLRSVHCSGGLKDIAAPSINSALVVSHEQFLYKMFRMDPWNRGWKRAEGNERA